MAAESSGVLTMAGMRSLAARSVSIALLPLLAAGFLAAGPARPAEAAGSRPNILLIVTDDQAWSTFNRGLMPSVFSQLVDRGALFRRAYVSTPVCCPSRAQILTGLYQHHNGVIYNTSELRRRTIVGALKVHGYRTMLAGKYLNSHPCTPLRAFTRWVCAGEGRGDYSQVDPLLNVDGAWRSFEGATSQVLARHARSFIANTPRSRRFFVLYAPTTPHLPADDPRHAGLSVEPFRPRSFDERMYRSGKPGYMRRGPLTAREIAAIDDWHARMSRSARALDDSIAWLLEGLRGRKRNTLVIFLSDNGYLYGEHRRWDKGVPYEESVRVPFVIRFPLALPDSASFRSLAVVQNIDVAPTIADLAGIRWRADGRSLRRILAARDGFVRRAALLSSCSGSVDLCPGGRWIFGQRSPPGFWGVVTGRYKFVAYGTGMRELYDLRTDPSELVNRARSGAYAGVRRALARKLAYLRSLRPVA
jgi:arylsulfatase A-like enzyme